MFDKHLINGGIGGATLSGNYSRLPDALGYTYPEWYSGSVDSPAKIAQQLYKSQKYRNSVTTSIFS